ncbi:hypothetical protein LCGC14_2427520 [marine sediment metagenome]|uniref:Uncharacterized protein n=1 Tax=marine sediment metagenome TaxID=412755 RepID=A0A0F9CA67_9ZZZZ
MLTRWVLDAAGNTYQSGFLILDTASALYLDGGIDTSIRESTADVITFQAGGTDIFSVFADVRVGTGSAIATNAITGFLLIPGCAGAPTGDPTNDGVGAVALVYDTTNNLLYANDGGGWVAVNNP